MKISVFTVCMPEFTPEETVPKLREWGADGVEWRVTAAPAPGAPVKNFWNGNRSTVDPAVIVEQAPALRALARRHKLATPALAGYYGYAEVAVVERMMEAAVILGAKGVRVGVARYDGKTPYPKVLSQAAKGWEKIVKLGRKYGVRPLAEIHMGTIVPSASAMGRFVSHFAAGEVGVIHDVGNMICEGKENWQMGLEILGPYLAHVHVKNGSWSIRRGDPDGNLQWEYESDTLRRGAVNWNEVIAALRSVKYNGWLSLEDFAPGNTETKIKEDIAYLRQLLK